MKLPTAAEYRSQVANTEPSYVITDREGRFLGMGGGTQILKTDSGEYIAGPAVDFDALPEQLITDLKMIEGFSEFGFDPVDIARALLSGIGGGSTITQQVFRLLTRLPKEETSYQTYYRKLIEIVAAVKLSTAFTEEEILEIYLNRAAFSHSNYAGIEAAALNTFGKRAEDLTRGEWIALTNCLPQPSRCRVSGPEWRRDWLAPYEGRLRFLSREGLLEASEFERWSENPPVPVKTSRPPIFGMYLNKVRRELRGRACSSAKVRRVKTTLSRPLQEAIHDSLRQSARVMAAGVQPTALILSKRQEVLAYYQGRYAGGSEDYITTSATLPASRFKPFVYALYIEQLLAQGLSRVEVLNAPVPTVYRLGARVIADDAPQRTVPLHEAVARSYNASAYWVIEQLSPERVVRFAETLGIRGLEPYPSIALGSLGVPELDLAAGFSTLLQRYGRAGSPSSILEVEYDGDTPTDCRPPLSQAPRVLSAEASLLLRNILTEAVWDGTGTALFKAPLRRYALFAKTGTTSARSSYRYLGMSGGVGPYTFSMTLQGRGVPRYATSGRYVGPELKKVLHALCAVRGC